MQLADSQRMHGSCLHKMMPRTFYVSQGAVACVSWQLLAMLLQPVSDALLEPGQAAHLQPGR
jgi:hypothetical protein